MPKIRCESKPRDAIPRNIKILLAAREMKQVDLARRMNVSEGTVSQWLSGKVMMQLDDLDHIAEILHTTPAKLYSQPESTADGCMRFMEVV